MSTSHQQNAGQEHKRMTANQDVENEAKIKYQITTLTNQNCKDKSIKSRLK